MKQVAKKFWSKARKIGKEGFLSEDALHMIGKEAPQHYVQHGKKKGQEKKASGEYDGAALNNLSKDHDGKKPHHEEEKAIKTEGQTDAEGWSLI
jgi:hypothetical protein